MIDVKGTRTTQQDFDPAQRYVFKGLEERSRMPAYVGAFIAAVGLWLQQIMPARSQSKDDLPAERRPPQDGEAPHEPPAATPSLRLDDSPALPPGPPGKSGTNILDLPRQMSFVLDKSPAFDFAVPMPRFDLGAFRSPPVLPMPANDNLDTPAPVAAGGGSGGGGDPARAEADADDDGDDTREDEDDHTPAGNRAPRVSGPVYLMDVVGSATLAIGLADLLRNAEDPDGDPMTVTNLRASTGTLQPNGDGWLFTSGSDRPGPVVISYEISDGRQSVVQTAHFSVVQAPPIIGTAGDDALVGTTDGDRIDAGGGDDLIDAGPGNDMIFGSAGDDHIVAGDGDDVIFAGAGHDIAFAGTGDDVVSGGPGDDHLFGEDGNDLIFADDGDDTVSGGKGNDALFGGAGSDAIRGDADADTILGEDGDDRLYGGGGDDRIDGGDGDDQIDGGDGNDVIIDGAGRDEVTGGDGDDHLIATLDNSDDSYAGGAGRDVMDYSAASADLAIDLLAGTASGDGIGTDSLSELEVIIGGSGDDHYVIGNGWAYITGGAGSDIFEFRAPDFSLAQAPVFFEITDFQVGDRLRMSKHDLFAEVFDELGDKFESVYGEGIDEDRVRLRYNDERSEELDLTALDADFDRDGVWETSIDVHGQHVKVVGRRDQDEFYQDYV